MKFLNIFIYETIEPLEQGIQILFYYIIVHLTFEERILTILQFLYKPIIPRFDC